MWPWPPRPTSKKAPTFHSAAILRLARDCSLARGDVLMTLWSVRMTTRSGLVIRLYPIWVSWRCAVSTYPSCRMTNSGSGAITLPGLPLGCPTAFASSFSAMVIGMRSTPSITLSLGRLQAGQLRHRVAAIDLGAFVLLGFGLLLGEGEHVHDALSRDETHARVVGHDEVARFHADAADDHRSVDLDCFEPPFAGHRRALGRPDRIAKLAGLADVADASVDDCAGFALTLANTGADAAHVGNTRCALDDEYVAGLSEIVAFDLRHAVVLAARRDHWIVLSKDVAQRKRGADHAGARYRRYEPGAGDSAANPELVERIGYGAGRGAEGAA